MWLPRKYRYGMGYFDKTLTKNIKLIKKKTKKNNLGNA